MATFAATAEAGHCGRPQRAQRGRRTRLVLGFCVRQRFCVERVCVLSRPGAAIRRERCRCGYVGGVPWGAATVGNRNGKKKNESGSTTRPRLCAPTCGTRNRVGITMGSYLRSAGHHTRLYASGRCMVNPATAPSTGMFGVPHPFPRRIRLPRRTATPLTPPNRRGRSSPLFAASITCPLSPPCHWSFVLQGAAGGADGCGDGVRFGAAGFFACPRVAAGSGSTARSS